MEEPIGSFKSYKITIKEYDSDEKKKTKSNFKVSIIDNDDESEEKQNEEIVLLIRRFKKFINSKKDGRRNFKRVREKLNKREKNDASKSDPITYNKYKKTQSYKDLLSLIEEMEAIQKGYKSYMD